MSISCDLSVFYFFFNDTATTEIYTLSLHDALPICRPVPATADRHDRRPRARRLQRLPRRAQRTGPGPERSEEHTSELQSRQYLVCRLLLEKKKKNKSQIYLTILQHQLLLHNTSQYI